MVARLKTVETLELKAVTAPRALETILPRGWLRDALVFEKKNTLGVVAIDAPFSRDYPEDPPAIRGWSMTRGVALQMAIDAGYPADLVEVHPCSRGLYRHLEAWLDDSEVD